MSEFQLHQFKTIDKPLDKAARDAMNALSSRADVTATSAEYINHYSDFRGDMDILTRQYFDASLYWANFGCRKVIFRFPKTAVDIPKIREYLFADVITLRQIDDVCLLIFDENSEDGGFETWMDDDDDPLSDFLALRNDILKGDYRALYMMWLHAHSPNFLGYVDMSEEYADVLEDEDIDFDEDESDDWKAHIMEPPVPAGLDKLTVALSDWADFFEMNKDWIASAATASPQADAAPAFDAAAELAKLSDAEKMYFLEKLLSDEPALSATFTRFLENKNPTNASKTNSNRRSVAEIEAGVANAIKARTQKEKAAAAAALKKRCDDLAKREAQAWKDVNDFCDKQIGSAYENAVNLLLSLKELAVYRNTTNEFVVKINIVIEKYSKSKAFIQRLQKAGFVVKL
jgi:hypothetical protein